MQKKILAVAIGALIGFPVLAQSNVTISGMAAISVSNYKVGNTSRMVTDAKRLDDDSSRFILKGTEDLGNGLSAYFQFENRALMDVRPGATTSQGLTDGDSFVGLKSKTLGQIGFGKYSLHQYNGEFYRASSSQMEVSKSILGTVSGNAIALNSRASNTIQYDSPDLAGFSARLAYSFAPGAAEGEYVAGGTDRYQDGGAWNLATKYNKGPINAYLSYYHFKPETQVNGGTTLTAEHSYRFSTDYTFPFGVRVGFNFDRSSLGQGTATKSQINTRNSWMIPVSYSFGASTVYLTYAKANDIQGTNKTGAIQRVLAYDYAFSKRTFAGVAYIDLKNDAGGAYTPYDTGSVKGGTKLLTGESARQFSFNLTHRF